LSSVLLIHASPLIVAAKTKLLGVQAKVGPLIQEAVADPDLAGEIIRTIDEVHRDALNDLAGMGEMHS